MAKERLLKSFSVVQVFYTWLILADAFIPVKHSVNREIFVLKNFRGLNFRVVKFSQDWLHLRKFNTYAYMYKWKASRAELRRTTMEEFEIGNISYVQFSYSAKSTKISQVRNFPDLLYLHLRKFSRFISDQGALWERTVSKQHHNSIFCP